MWVQNSFPHTYGPRGIALGLQLTCDPLPSSANTMTCGTELSMLAMSSVTKYILFLS